MSIERFEDIEAWRLARILARKIYALTGKGKFAQDFGLRNQIQNAAGSSMHNIAEGFDSGSNSEFIRFLRYAKRSCTEVQSELYLALDLDYISSQDFRQAYDDAGHTKAAIGGFIKYLSACSRKRKKPRTQNHEPAQAEPGTA